MNLPRGADRDEGGVAISASLTGYALCIASLMTQGWQLLNICES